MTDHNLYLPSLPSIEVRRNGLFGSARDNVPELEDQNDPWMENIRKSRTLLDVVTDDKRPIEDKRSAAQMILELCERIPTTTRVFVRGLANMAIVHRELGKAGKARDLYRKARKFVVSNNKLFDEQQTTYWLSTITMMEGKVFYVQGFHDEAAKYFLEAWALNRGYFLPLMNLFYVAFEKRDRPAAQCWYMIMETYVTEFQKVSELLDLKLQFLIDAEQMKLEATKAASNRIMNGGTTNRLQH